MNKTLAQKIHVHRNRRKSLKRIKAKFSKLFKRYNLMPAIVVALMATIYWTNSGAAQLENAFIELVRAYSLEEFGISNPLGMVFSQGTNSFQVLALNRDEFDPFGRLTSYSISPSLGNIGSSLVQSGIIDPRNQTFDNKFNRLLTFQPNSDIINSIEPGQGSNLNARSLRNFDPPSLGLSEPRGMVVDPQSGQLYVLDSEKLQIVGLVPDASGDFTNANITRVNLDFDQPGVLTGLAFDSEERNFHILNPGEKSLYEFDELGKLVALRDLSNLNVAYPSAIVFAPSADPTDDPSLLNLYLLDNPSGQSIAWFSNPTIQEIEGVSIGEEDTGQANQILELSFTQPAPTLLAVPTVTVTYVNTVDTSLYVPASPDPSGLAYISDVDRLLMSDGEVEEMGIFSGVNVWETTLPGVVTDTANLSSVAPNPLGITNEPTGVAWNPTTGAFFFTDDDSKKVFQILPGSDSLYFTGDDIVTEFNIQSKGSTDPEGIAFDSNRGNGHLLVADGLGAEIYDINLGSNGLLDPTDSVTNFDVNGIGIQDPEGIEFNAVTNHLYILGGRGTDVIAETTLDGTLLRFLNLNTGIENPFRPAGLAFAPASDSSGIMHLYILDRGVDNNDDPSENDGKMYEISIPNSPPTVNAGFDQSINFPNCAQLDGTVTDDGYPIPPGQITALWVEFDTPPGGKVTFGNASVVDTTACFSKPGSYTLMLDASDGEYVISDFVTIEVIEVLNQEPVVDAGPDQTITLPSSAALDGTVEDDGLPLPPNLVTTWSKLSGPGIVNFANASAVDTTASFSAPGCYDLLLEADDGEYVTFDSVRICVNPAPIKFVWLPLLISRP